MTMSS